MIEKILVLPVVINFCLSGLIINIIQALLFITVSPFSKKCYRKLNRYIGIVFFNHVLFISEWWSRSRLTLYISKEDKEHLGKEHCIALVNHHFDGDWMFLVRQASKFNGIVGNCRAFAKKPLRYYPVIGWFFYFNEYIFLERSFEKDQQHIKESVEEKLENSPDPIIMCLFPEGTRYTHKKHLKSVEYARSHNLTPLKHLLIPKTKGFIAVMKAARGKKCAIYDYTLHVKKNFGTATVMGALNRIPYEVSIYQRRIPLENIPEDEEKAAAWLQKLFVEKDAIIESFEKTGSTLDNVEEIVIGPSIWSFVSTFLWMMFTVVPLVDFLVTGTIDFLLPSSISLIGVICVWLYTN
ncbi:AGPAT3.2 family protein [Megaselia abdita]